MAYLLIFHINFCYGMCQKFIFQLPGLIPGTKNGDFSMNWKYYNF